ncbi:MAG: glycosyltransferase family 1 protein, partial [Acidimicrobiales bacterium]
MNLRVGINLLWLVPGVVGGTEEYAVRLLGGLARHLPDDLDVTLFALPSLADRHPDLITRYPSDLAPAAGRRPPLRVGLESTWLAQRSRRRSLDLLHHWGGTVPLVRTTPALVTVHDLQPLHQPRHFGIVKRSWLAAVLPWSVRTSVRETGLVAAVSRFTGEDLSRRLGTDPAVVRVIPHGVDPITPPGADEVDRVRRRYRLGERWFVHPAVTWPHKNHVMLLRAFAAVAADREVELVLTGAAGPAETDVAAAIEHHGLGARVRRTGRIPRADLDALIAGAVALTFPSRFEGYGAPVLEAMALGCPVVAARATALPEAVGDGGILLDPDDTEQWTRVMLHLMDDQGERRRLITAGHARVDGAGWDRSGAALVDA